MTFNLLPKYKSNHQRLLLHVLFWVSYVLFFTILWGSYDDHYYRELKVQILLLPGRMLIVYFNLYFLLPRFLLKKRYLSYVLWLIPTSMLIGMLSRSLIFYFYYPIYNPGFIKTTYLTTEVIVQYMIPAHISNLWSVFKVIKYAVGFNTVLLLTTGVKILKFWYKDKQAAKLLEKEKLEAELKFLKGQIHPHFLFNTLNNLYALTLKKDEHAPEIVLKLSDLMNYMLYDTNTQYIDIEKEINYIKNYIALEKIRYGNRVDISFNIAGQVAGNKIAPMLILPFVENSFKHGVSGEIDHAWITIDLLLQGNQMTLKVENSKSTEYIKRSQREYASGIGLVNVKRRLDLLYTDQYELKVFDEEPSTYLVVLKLTLESSFVAFDSVKPQGDQEQISPQKPVKN
ncbi:sensor histidine kinase [Microscilla marina]|uniref:Putative two component system, sensor protein n=1 Tax=Microscilla marina ATCC 23134 TaxID=313606 RepID=A1ZNY7_MICM2|nr:histidine kinase [Microscilla marina]EAY27779.1 putative two component system, sensor protein [Microscilla marina ATCC 23134]